jgi:5-methylthioadenosine/S-adenosylhomocysteine deaminase
MSPVFIISPRYLLPIEPARTVLDHHSLVIKGNIILDILPTDIARQQYVQSEEMCLDHHVLMPGLINLHSHSAMSLLRGFANDVALMDWLNHHIWPAEKKHVSDEFVLDGTLIGMAEMIRGGTTTVNDMYFHYSAVAQAGLQAGMRTFVGCSILEFPTDFASTADEYIAKALAQRAEFIGESLIHFTLAPHAPYSVSDQTFQKINTLAEQYDMRIHCHIHETQAEIEQSLKEYDMRPLTRLHKLGMLTPRLIAAHMVVTNDAELDLLQTQQISIAHNPASNMKLASGIARIHDMQQRGITVGLGTDGPASNNKLDLFADMRLAALLAKVSGNPEALPAFETLHMATLQGAKALGIDQQVGSLVPGKLADIIAVDLSDLETQPCYDIASQLVYVSSREAVTHVWVNGNLLLKNRQLTTFSYSELLEKAAFWRHRIVEAVR